jgi:hypothetical protein
MTCRCQHHGFQLCVLVSPDLAHSELDASHLRLVSLFSQYEWGVKCEAIVTMTEGFAQHHAITQSEMDYEAVFVESAWYGQLHALCYGCYCQRWPTIIEGLKSKGY